MSKSDARSIDPRSAAGRTTNPRSDRNGTHWWPPTILAGAVTESLRWATVVAVTRTFHTSALAVLAMALPAVRTRSKFFSKYRAKFFYLQRSLLFEFPLMFFVPALNTNKNLQLFIGTELAAYKKAPKSKTTNHKHCAKILRYARTRIIDRSKSYSKQACAYKQSQC